MSRCVLVVDDDPLTREILGTILNLEEYEVELAEDGKDALARVNDDAPDIVVLDVMMPGIDGFEVCRRLKGDAATESLPVILLTARDTVEDRAAGAEAGCDAYLSKPFSPLALIETIRGILGTSNGGRA